MFVQNRDFLKEARFLPDATYGAVQSISFNDLQNSGLNGIVTTTLPAFLSGLDKISEKFGGVGGFFNYPGKILTDSGGFQVFSLIHKGGLAEKNLSDKGAIFTDFKNGRKHLLTPELSQQVQFRLKSDFRVVLDEPIPVNSDRQIAKKAMERTFLWAERAKKEFLRLEGLTEDDFRNPGIERSLLFAVVQGGDFLDLREESAKILSSIGFDGFGFGGSHLDGNGNIRYDLLESVSKNTPSNYILYGMGIGTPDNMIDASKFGYTLFDCVLPTRNARHGYLFVSKGQGDLDFSHYSVLHIKSSTYELDDRPIDSNCDCEACKTVSRAYLRHLIRMKEPSGFRLATIHNLRFFAKVQDFLNGKNTL